MSTTTNIYPGMVSNDIEFFHYNGELVTLTGGNTIEFEELPNSILNEIQQLLDKEKDAIDMLNNTTAGGSGSHLKRFVSCRFGGLDLTADINVHTTEYDAINKVVIQDGEYWNCPNRGKCAAEGVLCKMPVYRGQRLLPVEVSVLKELHTVDTNETIADRLGLALGTYHLIKKNLYKKLGGLFTRHEVTRVADSLNIR